VRLHLYLGQLAKEEVSNQMAFDLEVPASDLISRELLRGAWQNPSLCQAQNRFSKSWKSLQGRQGKKKETWSLGRASIPRPPAYEAGALG